MDFTQPLQAASLRRRYKRFLAEVELSSGEGLTVHCPNSGSLLGCQAPGSPVMISRSESPGRKYPHTLEMIRAGGVWVGIHAGRTNLLVREALLAGKVAELGSVTEIESEVKVSVRSRLDFRCRQADRLVYLEVKNCTLVEEGWAMFPDAVTARGRKHLEELIALSRAGHGAVVLFCIQRADARQFRPADHIDSQYGAMLRTAHEHGVLVLAYRAPVSPAGIKIDRGLPVELAARAL